MEHRSDEKRRDWVPPRPRLIGLVLALMVAANVFDAWATILIVQRGATELNPLMRHALDFGPAAFYAAKLCLVGGLSMFLAAASRAHRFAWRALCALTAVYMVLFGWHVVLVIWGPNVALVLPA